jgi:hypothetical protein
MTIASSDFEGLLPDGHVQAAFVGLCNTAVRIASLTAKSPEIGDKTKIVVDRRTLYKIVVSAYYDIVRYKHFHFSADHTKKSDAVKRAAYFTKWIIRFKPIQVVLEDQAADPDTAEPWLLTINEHLALQWACASIAFEHGLRGVSLTKKFRHDFIYDLQYRDMPVDGLIAIFQMISETIKTDHASPLFDVSR